MRSSIAVCLGTCLCASLFAAPPPTAGDPATAVQQIQAAILRADGPEDGSFSRTVGEGFAALFREVGPRGIPALQTHADDSIALQAAWHAVIETVPDKKSETAVHPDRNKLAWFLGFLEGRARVQAPKWWADSLLDTRAFGRDDVYPGRASDDDWLEDHHKSGVDFVCTPRGTSLKRDGDRIVMQVGTESSPFPAAILTEHLDDGREGQLLGCVSGLITRSRCYVAVHDNTGYPHKLFCIDRTSGETTWKAKVWGNFWGDFEGHPTAWVSIVESEDRVFVFESSSGMNVEAFRLADGKPLFRFATTYRQALP